MHALCLVEVHSTGCAWSVLKPIYRCRLAVVALADDAFGLGAEIRAQSCQLRKWEEDDEGFWSGVLALFAWMSCWEF